MPELLRLDAEVEQVGSNRFYRFQERTYPSVTTVLSSTADKKWLEAWKKRIGAEEAELIGQEARDRGSAMHEYIEGVLCAPGDPCAPDTEFGESWMAWATSNLFSASPIPLLVESPVYSTLGFAGTVDAVIQVNDRIVVYDWKTASKPKQDRYIYDYKLQVAAYAAAIEELYGVDVDHGEVIIAVPGQPAQQFEVDHRIYIDGFRSRLHDYYWG